MAQHQSARFKLYYDDFRRTSSVTTMLNNLHWQTLETRRYHAKLLMQNNIIAVLHDHLIRSVLPTQGHDSRFIQLTARTNTYLNSFFPSTVRLWNILPSYIIPSNDLEHFKANLLNLDNHLNFVTWKHKYMHNHTHFWVLYITNKF